MSRHVLAILAVVYALVAATYCNAQSVTVPVVTVDVDTHIAVRATVEFKGPESRSVETDTDGRASVSLIPGEYQETITAPGYKTVTFPWVIHPGVSDNGPAGAQLEPVKEPEEIAAANTQIRPGYTVVYGYAVDDQNQPVADVRIRLRDSIGTVETTTNYRGFYLMQVPTPPETRAQSAPGRGDDLPGTATITAEKPGYKTRLFVNVVLMNGSTGGVYVEMTRGSGTVQTDDAPAWLNGTSGTNAAPGAQLPPKNEIKSPKLQREKAPGEHENSPVSLGSIIPPDTMIRARTSRPTHTIAWRAAQISD